jgi:hypothetical protein
MNIIYLIKQNELYLQENNGTGNWGLKAKCRFCRNHLYWSGRFYRSSVFKTKSSLPNNNRFRFQDNAIKFLLIFIKLNYYKIYLEENHSPHTGCVCRYFAQRTKCSDHEALQWLRKLTTWKPCWTEMYALYHNVGKTLRILYCTVVQPVDDLGTAAIVRTKMASMKEKARCVF